MSINPSQAHDCPTATPVDLSDPGRLQRARRAALLVRSTTQHLSPLAVKKALGREVTQLQFARGLRRVCEDLGATFLKYGQVIASSPTLFGNEMSDEFRSCLDTGPMVPFDVVHASITSSLGRPVDEVFAEIDPVPLGRASLAVVHKAVTKDGRTVAVKVLRPSIERVIATDLALMQPLFDFLGRQLGPEMAGPLGEVLDGLRKQLSHELDLRNEALVMDYFRTLPSRAEVPLIIVPEPYHDLSSARVLTMEFLDGVPVDDLSRIEEMGVDPKPVVEQAVKAWFMTAIRGGIFHGDVHAGNILLLRDGRIAMIDWGIVGRLDNDLHTMFRQLIAFALGDESAWDDVATFFVELYGPLARQQLGIDEQVLISMFKEQAQSVLTQPFGQVSLADLLMLPQKEIARARREEAARAGEDASNSAKGRIGRYREFRKRRDASNGMDVPSLDHGMILLGKQLAYFERYGKMYLSDVPLLNDPDFFTSLLTQPSLLTPGS